MANFPEEFVKYRSALKGLKRFGNAKILGIFGRLPKLDDHK
jgi:hypothetical protein